jgi:hypothetical protein
MDFESSREQALRQAERIIAVTRIVADLLMVAVNWPRRVFSICSIPAWDCIRFRNL